jgi:hypothetical protein
MINQSHDNNNSQLDPKLLRPDTFLNKNIFFVNQTYRV